MDRVSTHALPAVPGGTSLVASLLKPSPDTEQQASLGIFRREVDRAVERDGGRKAQEARAESSHRELESERRESSADTRAAEHAGERSAQAHARGSGGRAATGALARPAAQRPAEAPAQITPDAEPGAGGAQARPAPEAARPRARREETRASGSGGARTSEAPPPPASPAQPAPVQAAGAAARSAAPEPTLVPALDAATRPEPPRSATPAGPAGAEAPPSTDEAEEAARVLDQLRGHLDGKKTHLSIELHPAELGRVALHVALRGGRLTAIVRAESAHTLGLIEKQLPELRASLAHQGLEAEHIELVHGFGGAPGTSAPSTSSAAAAAAGGFPLAGDASAGGEGRRPGPRAGHGPVALAVSGASSALPPLPLTPPVAAPSTTERGVDLYA